MHLGAITTRHQSVQHGIEAVQAVAKRGTGDNNIQNYGDSPQLKARTRTPDPATEA